MKLNKETKHSLEIGDVLRLSDGDYIIRNMWASGYHNQGLNITLTDPYGRTIYGMPSSQLYGAEIIKAS